MLGLLKTDFRKIFKSILPYIGLAVCVGFPLFILGLTRLGLGNIDTSGASASILPLVDFAFSPMLIVGLMVPTFAAILVGSDFTSGMTRNKIISGQSKTKIYFSYFISTMALIVVLSLVSFGSFILFGVLFFNIQNVLKAEQFIWFMCSGILGYVFVSSFVVLLTTLLKNPSSIPFVILADLIIGTVCMAVIPMVEQSIIAGGGAPLNDCIYLVPFYGVTISRTITNTQMTYSAISFVLLIGLNLSLGILAFKRTDIK